MHTFLHGIRRASCWPVASPLAFARLPCLLPVPILHQPVGYGDLLPKNGDEDEAEETEDLLPFNGTEPEEEEADNVDLPPSGDVNGEGPLPLRVSQGDEQDDGEGLRQQPSHGDDVNGLLLAYRSGESADFKPSTTVLCDFQSQIKEKLRSNLGILSPKSNVDVPVNMKMSMLSESQTQVCDPGGLSCLHEILFACQPASIISNRHSTFAADHDLLDGGGAAMLIVKKSVATSVHANIQVANHPFAKACGGDPTGYAANSVDKDYIQSSQAATPHFLIPLRGRRCDQWNDEVEDEGVATLKTKIWMKMQIRLLYITKDLLDPG